LAHAFDAEDLDEAKTFTVSNGQLYLSLNSTTLLVGGLVLLVGLALVALFVVGLPGVAGPEPIYNKHSEYQNYYDPDLAAANSPHADAALAYAYSAHHQQQQDAYRQKRSLGAAYNLATKMSQLETAFKKFEVETEECQKFVACEAAQIHKLKKNSPVINIVNRILSNPGDESKVNPTVLAAFRQGQAEYQGQKVNACESLREVCYAAHSAAANIQ